ncbi:MAG TPA: PAS domain-containing protein [Polyangia bacterium]|nr:PAS domain-containing protein [Polyangia bacterium]
MKGDETAPSASARELQRLQALRTYALSDAATQRVLRELTDLTAQTCMTPFAAVAFVDEAQTRFEVVSGVGFPCTALPRELSFCGYAIQQADLLVVPDATLDARLAGISLIASPPHIRFYAGAPLVTSEGHVLGTLCIFDRLPRELSAAQQTVLRVLSGQVMAQLDLRRQILRWTQSEDRLTLATDAAAIGVWDWDLTTDEWYASPVYCSMLGYPPDTGPSDRVVWLERLHPDDREMVVAKIRATIENPGGAYEYEARMRHANGSYRWIHVVGRVLAFDERGRAARLIGVRMDVTERKLAELRLRESEDRFRQLAENIQEVFWMTDPSRGRFEYISPAYEKVWGRSCASLRQTPGDWLAAVHSDDRPRVAEAIATTQARGHYDETYRIFRPDGTVRWIHDRAYVVCDGTGQVVRLVGTAEDITEARQLEAQLRQSQRLEAVGRLAGGIAHDFNNLLTVIQAYTELITNSLSPDDPTRAMIDEVQRAGERAVELTRQLLAFSRQQVLQTRVIDLNAVVVSLTKMLRRILGEDIDLRVKLNPRPLLVRADAGMLDQVLMNLVVNAREAMTTGGRLTIETSERRLTVEPGRVPPEVPPGRYGCVSVADTGPGIPPQHLARIFEPFYTTKDTGKGTGLGLATAFGIVKQHGGTLIAHSVEGQGATFQVLLPSTEDDEGAAPEPPARPIERGGGETVLVVEDEATVRRVTRLILEQAGYRVLEASDAAEALHVWDSHQGIIDLLMTDIVMPGGIDGRALAERLCLRRPELRVILTSGYSAEIAGRDLSLRRGHVFLQKPASPSLLLDCVRRCLTGLTADG